MWLSRIALDARQREVRRDLADCVQMHRTVMAAFEDVDGGSEGGARSQHGVLWRTEVRAGAPAVLLVQSRSEPNTGAWQAMAAEIDSRSLASVAGQFAKGKSYRFRLRANPTRTESRSGADGLMPRQGVRIPVRGTDEQIAWLVRQGESRGFRVMDTTSWAEVPDVIAVDEGIVRGRKPGGMPLSFASVRFDGRLVVTDPERFVRHWSDGIGRGKAYGFGLLSVAP